MSKIDNFIDIEFIGSFPSEKKMPVNKKAEYAFIGRSNVGKSSLINYLSLRKDIAKTSKKPGKTQMINLFDVKDKWSLVDLPGYGYASVARKKRQSWMKMIYDYLEFRPNLAICFVLIDSRIPFQDIDRNFILWLGKKNIPFALVFTKIDALKPLERKENIGKIKNEILKYWETLPETFEVSSVKKIGRENIINYINEINKSISN
ncbi:MAG TPA: YihA family ribosome biogenesis GTP-binding protein [Saprospiraceae bacterium]|nr:YihA family ribosome biogenesis GTP-binding protein [Saprospiraceae bacterium]HHH54065.1 YihA family ribosome biogenesis GTP-binding protein [Bacteroidota bacterium]